jgi:hypothetical protein
MTKLIVALHNFASATNNGVSGKRKISGNAIRKLAIGDRLEAPSYLSRVDRYWKIRVRKQRTDIGKYSFVNRSITDWAQLSEAAIVTSHGKTHIFKTRVRKVKTGEGKRRR